MPQATATGAAGTETGGSQAVICPHLHHIFLKTTRLDEMKAWYATVLGLRPNFEWDDGAFMTNDDANHRLVIFTSPAVTEDTEKVVHSGLHHMAYEYGSGDDLIKTYGRLKSQGIRPHAALDHGLTMSFYYLDPDGNSLELQYDNFGDWAKSTEFMRTSPAFAADPIGKPVDPEALVEARMRGLSLSEIHDLAYAGEMAPAEPDDIRIPV
jgi:catechol 2,3-dioxygenase